jgi:hypothetical protein
VLLRNLPPRPLKSVGRGGGTSSAFAGGGVATPAPMRALDLFDSGSSASDGAVVALVPRRKCPWKFPLLKAASKPSDAPATKGISTQSFHFSLVLEMQG